MLLTLYAFFDLFIDDTLSSSLTLIVPWSTYSFTSLPRCDLGWVLHASQSSPNHLRNHVSTLWIVLCLSWDSCEGADDVGLPVLPLVVCVRSLSSFFFVTRCRKLPPVLNWSTLSSVLRSSFRNLCLQVVYMYQNAFAQNFFWTRVFVRN